MLPDQKTFYQFEKCFDRKELRNYNTWKWHFKGYMKILFLILILLFSCEKQEIEKQCWICTEIIKKSGTTLHVIQTETCDIQEMLSMDGKRTIEVTASGYVITHFTECEKK